ncbi:hypothetical protein [Zhihengliuella salsuginis]|uniref:Uncharacterized protein n=1 Tax=Zhihengliuella salsuginis TaxID=578222 RepID=A0ABQ3GK22_9MICC|nr:hypothetical protein [Zhihengliuella salsuginis]GHD08258.1 hypothetical protein GCM10008096_19730 [Zhihengliuella salsuginis]
MFVARVPQEFITGTSEPVAKFFSTTDDRRESLKLTRDRTYELASIPKLAFVDHSTIAFLQHTDNSGATVTTSRHRLGLLRELQKITVDKLFAPSSTSTDLDRILGAVRLARWIGTPVVEAALRALIKHAPRNALRAYRPYQGTVLEALLKEVGQGLNDGTSISNALAYIYFYNELLRATAHTSKDERLGALTAIHRDIVKLDRLPLCVALSTAITSVTSDWTQASRVADRARQLHSSPQTASAEPETGVLTFGTPRPVEPSVCRFTAKDLIGDIVSRGTGRPCILYSGDPRFIRTYAPRLFFYMTAFPEFDYHFLIIGSQSEASACASDLVRLQEELAHFQHRTAVPFSASYCEVPDDVDNIVSFYASARFLFANKQLEGFPAGLWIQDLDLFPDGDFTGHLARMQAADISIVASRSLAGLMPWKRYLAGSVFIRPTTTAGNLLNSVAEYLRFWLTNGGQWMVDQNALSYAIDQNPNIVLYDMSAAQVPLRQSTVNSRLERVLSEE